MYVTSMQVFLVQFQIHNEVFTGVNQCISSSFFVNWTYFVNWKWKRFKDTIVLVHITGKKIKSTNKETKYKTDYCKPKSSRTLHLGLRVIAVWSLHRP